MKENIDMRKFLAIILTLAMLLSTALLAITASAAGEEENKAVLTVEAWEKPWEDDDPTVSGNWEPIGSEEEWFAVFDGVNNDRLSGHKYYLTADLDFNNCRDRSPNGESAPSNFVLDGNGHSITLATTGKNMVLFDKPGNMTIQNLIIKGNVIPSGNQADNYDGIYICPFAKWDQTGWTKMYNVTSAVNVNYQRMVSGSQFVGGVVSVCRDGSELENVKFVGSINIGNRAMVAAVGGIAARTYENVSMKNCVNEGAIQFQGKHAFYAAGAKSAPGTQFMGVGGIVGIVDGATGQATATLEGCVNNGNIFYSGFEMYYHEILDYENDIQGQSVDRALKSDGNPTNCRGFVGGIAGQYKYGLAIKDCVNNGDIFLGDACTTNYVGYVGGIAGGVEQNAAIGISVENTVNNGDITATYPHPLQVGGMVGYIRNNAENSFNGCVNNGKVTSYKTNTRNTDFTSVGGFIGYVYGAQYVNQKITMTDCVNNGDLVSADKGIAFKEMWGGFVAQACAVAEIYFENCVNKGNVLMPLNRSSADFMGAAGFLGCFRTVGYSDWAGVPTATYTFKNCYNIGEVTGLHSGGFFGDNAEIKLKEDLGITVDNVNVILENCVNAGNIKGKIYAGGIGAFAGKGGGYTMLVKNCANGGTVTADTNAGGFFGILTSPSVVNVENAVNYGSVGVAATGTDMEGIIEGEEGAVSTTYAKIAGGFVGGKDGIVSMKNGINMGAVKGTEFSPFTVGGLLESSNNKYLISATIGDDFSGGEAVEDPIELVNATDAFGITYASNLAAIKALISAQKVMNTDDYLTTADWEGFKKACEAADAVISAPDFDPATFTQKEANTLYVNILKAYGTIARKTDVTELNAKIAEAKNVLLDGNEYTSASIKTLQRAISDAEAVAALGESAKSTDVEKYMNAIDKAIAKMRTMPQAVDYTALEDLIESVADYKKRDFMLASWENFESALKSAKMALSATKQLQVDEAVAALEKAIAALKPKDESNSPSATGPAVTEPSTDESETDGTQNGAEGGCGSVIGSAAVILTAVVALGAGVSLKKKED